jgi:hypothetical protein
LALCAIETFEQVTAVDRQDAICDLLADLMHFGRRTILSLRMNWHAHAIIVKNLKQAAEKEQKEEEKGN